MGFLGGNIVANLVTPKMDKAVFQETDTTKVAKKAVESAEAIQPRVEALQDVSSEAATSRRLKQFSSILGPAGLDKFQANIRSGLSGELPRDVINNIQRQQAELGIKGGIGGSELSSKGIRAELLRTSQATIERSMSTAQQWFQVAASGMQQFDFSGLYGNFGQVLATDIQNKQGQFQVDMFNNQLDVEQSFGAAVGRDAMETEQFIQGVVTEVAGSIGGKMMG